MHKIVIVLLVFICSTAAAAAEWQGLADMPQAVQEIYPAVHKGKIYVAGGLSDTIAADQQQMTAAVQIYDVAENSWRFGPSLPEARHHAYLVSVEERLFLFGGFVIANGGRWSASADVLVLDEASNSWHKVATLPKPLTETTAVVLHGRVHLASGRSPLGPENAQWRDQHDVNWHWVFDPNTYSVTSTRELPQAFNSAAGVAWNEQFFIVGGRQVNGGNLAALQRFDPQKAEWQNLAALPRPQGGLAVVALADALWVFGGEYFDEGGGVYQAVWKYRFAEDRWQQHGVMPLPRHGLGAVSIDNDIYIIGGATAVGLKATSAVLERFRVKI